jgi:hypothetical protein
MHCSRFGHVEETLWRLKNLDLRGAPRTLYSFKSWEIRTVTGDLDCIGVDKYFKENS